MEIKINTKGEILNPEDELKYIYIDGNAEEIEGYYVFFSDKLENVETGRDTWVGRDELEKYIKNSGFIIKWLED